MVDDPATIGSVTEAWVRNPLTCIRECAELAYPLICWDRGYAHKMRVDPQRHIELHYPSSVDYRLLLMGDQGTAELRRGYSMEQPYAVYPTWEFGVQTIADLEAMMATPPTPDYSRPPDERAVLGQEHRVVVIRPPDGRDMLHRAFVATLRDLVEEYPDAKLHLHGVYSYRAAFAHGWAAADIDPVSDARRGKIVLGSGKVIRWEEAPKFSQWVNLHHVTVGDLSVARNRTMFNIRTAEWAGKYFNTNVKFVSRGKYDLIDPDAIEHVPVETAVPVRFHNPTSGPMPGDKLACDMCRWAPTCKYFRDGGVCAIPDTDGSSLVRYFGTRDSGQIIDGLGKLMQTQARRLEEALDREDIENEGLDAELTKLANMLFGNGVKLAKLVDPALAAAGAAKIGIINVNGGSAAQQIGQATPQQIMRGIVAELQAQGISREEITPQMVADYIAGQNRQAIEAAVVD